MTNDQLENEFDEALQRYLDLGESAAIIVREMKKRGPWHFLISSICETRIGESRAGIDSPSAPP
jgi:hypothetical protein